MNRNLNRLNLLESYLRGETVTRGLPIDFHIELTSRCNLDCVMCDRKNQVVNPVDMDFDLFKKIIDEIVDFAEVVLPSGLGESLLHPNFLNMMAYIKKFRVPVILFTNGTLLDEENSNNLLKMGIENIIFSVDSIYKEKYEKYRKGAQYENVLTNIRNFIRLKNEMGSRTIVTILMVIMRDNINEVDEFKRFWKNEGANKACVIENFMKEDEDIFPPYSNFMKINPDTSCPMLWRGNLAILSDGRVVACCKDYNDLIIGNIKESTIKELWNSNKMQKLRKLHAMNKKNEIFPCNVCRSPQFLPPNIFSFIPDAYRIRRLYRSFENIKFQFIKHKLVR